MEIRFSIVRGGKMIYTCDICGAMVVNTRQHANYHRSTLGIVIPDGEEVLVTLEQPQRVEEGATDKDKVSP